MLPFECFWGLDWAHEGTENLLENIEFLLKNLYLDYTLYFQIIRQVNEASQMRISYNGCASFLRGGDGNSFKLCLIHRAIFCIRHG